MTKTFKFIRCVIARHADFGGGTIEADLPDCPQNRAAAIHILYAWTQELDI